VTPDSSSERSSSGVSESTSKEKGKVREQRALLLVLPNDLESHHKTYLRDTMLQALVNIRARNGQTPTRVVDLLLCFVDNILTT
jgi:hypothetical protein